MHRIILLLIMLSTATATAWGQQTQTVNDTVDAFYEALRIGNVVKLRKMIDDPFYSQVKVLLTRNTEYPSFLRTHYKGSSGVIRSSNQVGERDATVDFEVTYRDGSAETLRFRLRGQPDGTWKIVEQQLAD